MSQATSPTFKAFMLLKKGRYQKKKDVYKMAISVLVDKVTAFYLILIGGYIIGSLFIFNDYLAAYQGYFDFLESNTEISFSFLVVALPLRYILNSFSNPGVLYSSSEKQLTYLTYSKHKLWITLLIQRLIVKFFIYTILFVLIMILTPLPVFLVSSYIGIIFLFDILMATVQWKLFQQSILIKIAILIGYLLIDLIAILTKPFLFSLIVIVLLIGLQFYLYKTLFIHVNWKRVTDICDFKIWNMALVSFASDTKFTKVRQYSFFINEEKDKQPFKKASQIYNRLWRIYLAKNIGLILQITGTLIFMLIAFQFLPEWILYIGIVVAIYVYSTATVVFFKDRFRADLIEALPWDLQAYKKAYIRMVHLVGIIVLLPLFVYFIKMGSLLSILMLLYTILIMFYGIDLRLQKAISQIDLKMKFSQVVDLIYFGLLIAIGFLNSYPQLVFLIVVPIFLMLKDRSTYVE